MSLQIDFIHSFIHSVMNHSPKVAHRLRSLKDFIRVDHLNIDISIHNEQKK